jgi:hypothetical protein
VVALDERGDALDRIYRSRVEIIALTNHRLKIGDPPGGIIGIRHECRHPVMSRADVDRLARIPERFPGIVLHRLGWIVIDRFAGFCIRAGRPIHLSEGPALMNCPLVDREGNKSRYGSFVFATVCRCHRRRVGGRAGALIIRQCTAAARELEITSPVGMD